MARVPVTESHSMGLSPVPGRLAARLLSESVSPLEMWREATMLLRATAMLGRSASVTVLSGVSEGQLRLAYGRDHGCELVGRERRLVVGPGHGAVEGEMLLYNHGSAGCCGYGHGDAARVVAVACAATSERGERVHGAEIDGLGRGGVLGGAVQQVDVGACDESSLA